MTQVDLKQACRLYSPLFWVTPHNHCIQVFPSPPCPQLYKIQNLGMQTASTNICETTGVSLKLSELHCGTMVGYQPCNNSSSEMFSLLNIPQSALSGIITKYE
ncbi:hypothetical protein GOODEAATRI_031297 [Goodea atripinnis]|uniref:Uncharacterized protein n=1 Tax=Goodea atripinnis TaxID=208336 RepID=A0ABV0PT79_9TELE